MKSRVHTKASHGATLILAASLLCTHPTASEAARRFIPPHFALALSGGGIGDSNFAPAFADIDGDGDYDAFVGETNGDIYFFENTGSTVSPAFAPRVVTPFSLTNLGPGSSTKPAFADIDADGDIDAFVGTYPGSIVFFENIGSAVLPSFAPPTTDPFGLTDVGASTSPHFADIDADGDLDAFVGEFKGSTFFFENIGSPALPAFAPPAENPFGLTSVLPLVNPFSTYAHSSPAFADVDGDGDLDAFVGEWHGRTFLFTNTGSAASPEFALIPTTGNVGEVTRLASPAFVDIDADGDLDAFVGDQDKSIYYFQNAGSPTSPAFAELPANPFGIDNGSPVALADIDGDGDLDAFVGGGPGNITFLENVGSPIAPLFAPDSANPFGLSNVGSNSYPAFADIDADGDLDALVGERLGATYFFENTGSSSNPVFAPAVENPFGLVEIRFNSTPHFADLDGDGDLDGLYGRSNGLNYYFENTGSPAAPSFAATTQSPYGPGDIGTDSAFAFADIDDDGDLDAFSGSGTGAVFFVENTGSAASPVFSMSNIFARYPANPFGISNVGSRSVPAFADIDGDGDLDAFVSNSLGSTFFFENVFGCATTPAACTQGATKAVLSVRESTRGKEKVLAKMRVERAALSQSDFGDPLVDGGTEFGLCIYGDDGNLAGELTVRRAGENCGARPCWRPLGGEPSEGSGFAYQDPATASDGIRSVKIKLRRSGTSTVQIKATNRAATMPTGIARQLEGDTMATIQFHTSDGDCFSAVVDDVKRNDASFFKAR